MDPVQDGMNWYVYVNNNPLSYNDPTGLFLNVLAGGVSAAIQGKGLKGIAAGAAGGNAVKLRKINFYLKVLT